MHWIRVPIAPVDRLRRRRARARSSRCPARPRTGRGRRRRARSGRAGSRRAFRGRPSRCSRAADRRRRPRSSRSSRLRRRVGQPRRPSVVGTSVQAASVPRRSGRRPRVARGREAGLTLRGGRSSAAGSAAHRARSASTLIARSPSPRPVPGAAPPGAARSPGASWSAVVPTAPRADGDHDGRRDRRERSATTRRWTLADAHRRDLDRPGNGLERRSPKQVSERHRLARRTPGRPAQRRDVACDEAAARARRAARRAAARASAPVSGRIGASTYPS